MEESTQNPTPEKKKAKSVYIRWFIVAAVVVGLFIFYIMAKREAHEASKERDNSFAEAVPAMDGDKMFLMVRNHGGIALRNVKVALRNADNVSPTLDDTVDVGNIPPHGEQRTNIALVPKIDPATKNLDEKGEPMDVRFVIIKSQDAVYTEVIEFKPGTCSPWIARYLVDRNANGADPTKRVRVMNWSTETCRDHGDNASEPEKTGKADSKKGPIVVKLKQMPAGMPDDDAPKNVKAKSKE